MTGGYPRDIIGIRMDILEIKPGEIYKHTNGAPFWVIKEPTMSDMQRHERSRGTDKIIRTNDEFMVLQIFLEKNVALWIHVLGVNTDVMGWLWIWYTNLVDRENAETSFERII